MRAVLLSLIVAPTIAVAQPVDPYGSKQPAPGPVQPAPPPPAPTPTPAPPPPQVPADQGAQPADEAVLAEQVAQKLVERAQELFDAKVYTDAKQLAQEALAKSPSGAAAEHAKFLIKSINQQLGLDKPEPPKIDLTPIDDPTTRVDKGPEKPVDTSATDRRIAAGVHAGIYGGLLGATVGSFFSDDNPAAGAVAVSIAAGIAAGVYVPNLTEKLHMSEAQIRTTGSASVWGGVIGGLFGDAVTLKHTDGREVLVGSAIGATVGLAGGYLGSRENRLTTGDVALVDTFAGIGTIGGLTAGMLMQPHAKDAYAVNSIVGASAGIVTGLIAAPQTNTTQRRMLRVAGLSAAGGAAPFLLYAAIRRDSTTADERVTGGLSTAGLIVGAWLGFYLTSDMDEGLDTLDGKKHDDAPPPPAVVGRSGSGTWGLAGLGIQPLSQQLAPQQGMSLSLVSGAF